jgi:hypothetical protein
MPDILENGVTFDISTGAASFLRSMVDGGLPCADPVGAGTRSDWLSFWDSSDWFW